MILETIKVGREVEGALALRFPRPEGVVAAGGPDGAEPTAILSLASEGDMKYGDPELAANRARFLAAAGADPGRALGVELRHSRNALFPSDAGEHASLASRATAGDGADGIILRDPSLVATVTVADCMPIWLLDRGSGAFGVLHSGWKGTGILRSAVEGIARRWGSRPGSMSAILGPAIGSCCYGVPAERGESFAREFGECAAFASDGQWRIDLRAANVALAASLGLGALLSVDACTSCDGRFGSYRRQGGAAFTRMLAACGLFPLAHQYA